jgi:hypothetical protein
MASVVCNASPWINLGFNLFTCFTMSRSREFFRLAVSFSEALLTISFIPDMTVMRVVRLLSEQQLSVLHQSWSPLNTKWLEKTIYWHHRASLIAFPPAYRLLNFFLTCVSSTPVCSRCLQYIRKRACLNLEGTDCPEVDDSEMVFGLCSDWQRDSNISSLY